MLKKQKISLIIPCKNEANGIATLLKNVPEYVDEVLVVDNGSTDQTAKIARKHGARVITENRTQNGIGYGFAHITGMKHATGDIIVTLDGDNTYPLEDIQSLINHLVTGKLDFVVGSRFPLKDTTAISIIRQFGVFVLNFETNLLYGSRITDILSGMWVMNRHALDTLLPVLREGDWNLSPEIKLTALMHPDIATGSSHIGHYHRAGQSKQHIWKTGFSHLIYIAQRRLSTDNWFWQHLLQESKKVKNELVEIALHPTG